LLRLHTILLMSTARRTALASLGGALVLALAKLVVGLATGSLGILAEAAHSGMDAVAALLTVYAVGVAERPADREHPYGHGKAQHLSALAEAAILAAVAVWIAVEATMRLIEGSSAVSATWYAFVLMGVVLVVDAGRSAASLRVGRAEHNAALLANAAHFASDFVGSLAVLVGLVLVSFGVQGGDSVAAIFVSVIVLAGAARLAWINVDVLMDRAPTGTAGRIERAALSVPGVTAVRSVRVREAGGESFAEVVIGVSRLAGLERSHDTMDLVEQAVIDELGRAQVVVHAEPDAVGERANDRIAAAALRVPGVVETHNISVLAQPDGLAVTLHVRLPEDIPLSEAGAVVMRLKQEIRREIGVARVFAHVEPSLPDAQPAQEVTSVEPDVLRIAADAVRSVAGDGAEVVVYRQAQRLLVVTSVHGAPSMTVRDSHELASRIEDVVRERLDHVDDVIVEVI
jgi:cation diffusion facilitator family transporter